MYQIITIDHIEKMNNHKVAVKNLKNTGETDYIRTQGRQIIFLAFIY